MLQKISSGDPEAAGRHVIGSAGAGLARSTILRGGGLGWGTAAY
jgi:hypothetical protein